MDLNWLEIQPLSSVEGTLNLFKTRSIFPSQRGFRAKLSLEVLDGINKVSEVVANHLGLGVVFR